MKTLKQWFDGLSQSTQSWIESNCSAWFDKNQADYYRKPSKLIDEKGLNWFLNMPIEASGSAYSDSSTVIKSFAKTVKYLAEHNPEILRQDVADNLLLNIIKTSSSQKRTWLYLSDANKKNGFILQYGKRYSDYRLEFCQYLYLIDDFDKITIDLDKCIKPTLTPEVIEMIGLDEARKIAEKSDQYELSCSIKEGKPNVLIDELLFCKASNFTPEQKRALIAIRYWNTSAAPTESMVEDFFNRIVAVDHRYLRCLFNIIDRYPAIAMRLYTQKKPVDELTGNESVAEQYRYSKELRKLFVIAHMCSLRRISKVKSSIVKEVAPLLKIYGYKWDDIYDALYPEDGQLN